jgi:hypothetical protein
VGLVGDDEAWWTGHGGLNKGGLADFNQADPLCPYLIAKPQTQTSRQAKFGARRDVSGINCSTNRL